MPGVFSTPSFGLTGLFPALSGFVLVLLSWCPGAMSFLPFWQGGAWSLLFLLSHFLPIGNHPGPPQAWH